MKYIILGFIAFLLVGCGEKFDASTDKMAKISMERIAKNLPDDEASQFLKDFEIYTQPYMDFCDEGPGDCTFTNNVESLHGESDSAVVDIVAEHREYVKKMNAYYDEQELRNLVAMAAKAQDNLNDIWNIPVTAKVVTGNWNDAKGIVEYAVEYEINNTSYVDLSYVKMEVTHTPSNGGEKRISRAEFARYFKAQKKSLVRDYLGYFKGDEVDKVFDREGTFNITIIGAKPTPESYGMVEMGDHEKQRLVVLSSLYPGEYEALCEEFGYEI